MTTDWKTATPIAPTDLPATITSYLVVHQARDVAAALTFYAPDAEVTDEGHTYHGADEIGPWMSNAASEYTYTTELIAAAKVGDDSYDALHHLEGNFPGGVADLHFRFTLRDGLIARLIIET
jgi:ketosteroid isomerase-like protein